MMLGIGFLMMFLVMGLPLLVLVVLFAFGYGIFQQNSQPMGVRSTAPMANSTPAQRTLTFERYCSHCGAGLQADWTHCSQCGAPVQ